MMSDDFCPFLSPLIRFFISAPLFIKSDLAEPPPPLPSDVVYGRPLLRYFLTIHFEIKVRDQY